MRLHTEEEEEEEEETQGCEERTKETRAKQTVAVAVDTTLDNLSDLILRAEPLLGRESQKLLEVLHSGVPGIQPARSIQYRYNAMEYTHRRGTKVRREREREREKEGGRE